MLNACGEAADTSGLSGSYVLKNIEEDGVTLSEGFVAEVGLTLRLDPGGTGAVLNSPKALCAGDTNRTGFLSTSEASD